MAVLVLHMAPPVAAQEPDVVSNSLADHYRGNMPELKYAYITDLQTHDYSGNWDLDSDGIADRICFIGTGGAHLYYFLQITLSSDNSTHDLRFLRTDSPVLVPSDTLLSGNAPFGFSVMIGNDGPPRIVVRLDRSTLAAERARFKRLKVDSDKVAVSAVKGKVRVEGS